MGQHDKLWQDLEEFRVGFDAVRRALLREAGVELLGTRTRRRLRMVSTPGRGRNAKPRQHRSRCVERIDMISYRRPGPSEPRRRTFWTIRWEGGCEPHPFTTRGEAQIAFEHWGCFPGWMRWPVILEEQDGPSAVYLAKEKKAAERYAARQGAAEGSK